MSTVARWLGLDRTRWERVGADSLWTGLAIVLVTATLLSLARFGGLAGDAPRAFVRLALVTVWGWIGLSVAIAAVAAVSDRHGRPGLRGTLAVTGHAHVPLLVLAGVIVVAAMVLQLLGPGMIVALGVLGFWLPASLAQGLSATSSMSIRRAVATVAVPYVAWLALVARHTIGQVEHLL